MEALKQTVSTVIGKALIGVIVVLIGALVALGFHDLSVSGERNVLSERVKTKEAKIAGKEVEVISKVKELAFMKAWMERDKLDAEAKEAEFNRTMAEKPKFITSIKYVPTGDKCADLNAIAEEARKNAEGGRL